MYAQYEPKELSKSIEHRYLSFYEESVNFIQKHSAATILFTIGTVNYNGLARPSLQTTNSQGSKICIMIKELQ